MPDLEHGGAMTGPPTPPLRVALLSHNFHPEQTGIPAYNTAMARWLAHQGQATVVVHTGIPHYPWWQVPEPYAGKDFRYGRANEVVEGIAVRRVRHYVPQLPLSSRKRMLLDATWLAATWWDCFRVSRRPEVVVLIAPPFLSAALGAWLRWWWRVPVLYHVQDLQVDAAVDLGMIPPRLGRILLWLERRLLCHLDQVSTISRAMCRRLQAKAPLRQRVLLLPNWTDLSVMQSLPPSRAYRAEWGIPDGVLVMLYSGSLGRKQGVDVLIDAIALLPASQELCLVIAGEGPERAHLEASAQAKALGSRLRFIGLAPQERLAEFLSTGDIHCIPQRRAAADLVLPSKLTNILGVGRPVVVTAPPGSELATTVRRAGCGLVVEPEDPQALASAVARLCADATRRQAMGQAGRRYAEQHLDIHAVLGRLRNHLTTLVSRSRRSRAK